MLGGWETRDPPHLARWFSLEVTPGQAPYLFNEKGETQWASTSAELLATPAALHVFGHLGPFTDLTNQVFRAVDPRRRMPLRFEGLPLKIVDDLWANKANFEQARLQVEASSLGAVPGRRRRRVKEKTPW